MTSLIAAEPLDDPQHVPPPTCLLCHTTDDIMTSEALAAGAIWTCRRCGQRWTAARLATAAAYAASVAESRFVVTA